MNAVPTFYHEHCCSSNCSSLGLDEFQWVSNIYLQIKDLEQRLSKVTDSKSVFEEKLKTSEHLVVSLETELQSTKSSLEAREAELEQVQEKVVRSCCKMDTSEKCVILRRECPQKVLFCYSITRTVINAATYVAMSF